jgi:glycosyltransferase involved in cell wall biosynthesis
MLAEGLVAHGVDVTLFATLDSVTSASLDGVCQKGYADDPELDGRVWEALHVSHALARSAEFDLVHNHLDWLPLAFAEHCSAPLLTTVHGFSGPEIVPAYAKASHPSVPPIGGGSSFVSISDSDRRAGIEYVATVHHGVDIDELPFSSEAGADLVVLGRIHPDKGIHTAIEIARRAGRRLTICGIVQDERYFTEKVAPHIDGDRVVFAGAVGPRRRAEILGASAALLHPIAFEEPFGLSVVESMVCGTPVVAFGRGSMPEVVEEGVTGLLVSTVDEAVAAVDRVTDVSRVRCREAAVRRFDAGRMVNDYLAIYEKLTGLPRP